MKRPVCVFTDPEMANLVVQIASKKFDIFPEVKEEEGVGPDHEALTFHVVNAFQGNHDLILESLEEARRENPAVASALVICPECHSPHLEYPSRPHASGTMETLGKLVDKLSHTMFPGPSQFLCERCRCSWSSSNRETMTAAHAVAAKAPVPTV